MTMASPHYTLYKHRARGRPCQAVLHSRACYHESLVGWQCGTDAKPRTLPSLLKPEGLRPWQARQMREGKKDLGTHFFLLEKFWHSLWHSCYMLYEIVYLFTLDRLAQINIVKIFLFPLYFHISLFLSQNELWFEDIPTKNICNSWIQIICDVFTD